MSAQSYRVRVYTPGSTSLSTANVDFTLDSSRLKDAPTVLGSIVRPREGRTEAQPWFFDVTDVSSSFTAQLADSSGRLDLLNRIIVCQRNTDGGSYSNIGVGRISDVFLNPDVASYRVMVEDERVLERSQVIFNSSNTTHLYPPGPHAAYGPYRPASKGSFTVVLQDSGNAKLWKVVFYSQHPPMSDGAIRAIEGDMEQSPFKSTAGNFKHLRFNYGGTDYKVVSFGDGGNADQASRSWLDGLRNSGINGPVNCWIAAASSAFTLQNNYSSAYLHMMSAPPSDGTPLHIGGVEGQHPMQLVKDIYDGTYSSSPPKIRYSTAAFKTGTTGLLTIAMPSVRFRITEPAIMSEWLEDNLYAPFMVVPFTDSSGRITPKSIRFPNSTSAITFTFTGANLTEHPSWVQPSREMVTVLQIEHTNEAPLIASVNSAERPQGGADYIDSQLRVREVTHDRVTNLGRHTALVRAHGIHSGSPSWGADGGQFNPGIGSVEVDRYENHIRADIFNRFGDGPIMGTFASLTTGEAVASGDFVKMTLATFPNPAAGARSGTRVMQVLSRDITPMGPRFTYLDAGPSQQPTSSPTITMSSNTNDPKHSVRATIGGVAAGGRFKLEVAESSTQPAASSTKWQPWETGTTNGTYTIGRRKSNTAYWGRVANTKPNRLSSPWVPSTIGKTTQSITGPSAFTASSVKGKTVLCTWTNGDANYRTCFHADTSTSATFSTANEVTVLPPGANRFRIEGLTTGTKYLLGVRHRDDYGGYSTRRAASVTTTAASLTAPNMGKLALLSGGLV